jgi:hypothetical protein
LQIRVRITVEKSRFWIRICIKVKIKKLERLKMKPWGAVDAHKGGVEAHNIALKGL